MPDTTVGDQVMPDTTAGRPDVLASDERRYLRQFDLFRVITFVGVIGQHSVLWPVPGGSDIGWSLVMVLHATREAFFFLAALVACYSQLVRPRRLGALWYRRISQVLVPYLAWTLIYFGYTMAKTPMGASPALSTFWHDLTTGYYQLYFLVVLFQFYVLLPGLLWLVRVTRGRHVWVLGASVVLQLAMMTLSHYFSARTGVLHAVRAVDLDLLQSRDIVGYQLYLVAGALAAAHLRQVQAFVERHARRIVVAVLMVAAATEGYYAFGLVIGQSPGHASDLYQPIAVVWFVAAIAGLWALGWLWSARAAGRSPTRRDRLVTWASDASGGYYLGHVLVLQLLFSGLQAAGLTAHGTWGAGSALLFVGTLAGTGVLVAVLLRTPLRFVLTGPDRSEERSAMPSYPAAALPEVREVREDSAPAMASAITR